MRKANTIPSLSDKEIDTLKLINHAQLVDAHLSRECVPIGQRFAFDILVNNGFATLSNDDLHVASITELGRSLIAEKQEEK